MKNLLIFSCLLITLFSCKAQLPPGTYTSTNKKAISAFESGLEFYNARKDEKAKEELKKAIEKDPIFIEPHLLLAQMYVEANRKQAAIDEYIKALQINPAFDKKTYYNLGQLEANIGKYADAKKDLETYLKNRVINPDTRDYAEWQLENCNFALEAIKNAVPFQPKNMGAAINTNLDEYFPAVTADDQLFLFTRNNRTEQVDLQEDFLTTNKVNGQWQPAKLIGNGINTPGNEGAPTLSVDGQILFFTVCQDITGSFGAGRKGFGGCDIFYSQKVGNDWSKPYNLGPTINTKYRETQPSFGADGKTLYFVSNRPGGMGEHDIYVSVLKEDESWGTPQNLGNTINSKGDEQSVCIHPDGKTLYYSSNGRVGMGGFDIYMSRKNEKGEWSKAINIGYPINTYGDENSLLVAGSGKIAYFASNREGGFGGLDMYQFELYEAIRPDLITYMKGKVYDAKTKASLGAHFELIELESAKTVIVSDANAGNGEFLVTLPVEKNYALNVSNPGYLFYSENFSLKELSDKTKPFNMDVPMQPIEVGFPVELKNVFFETAQFDLKPESKGELNKLVAFLNLNMTMKIELNGHTDNVGDKKMNITLSLNRAKSVCDYLIANGIEAVRLTYKGYGDTQPKVANDSDENRSKNRRTEFKVTGK